MDFTDKNKPVLVTGGSGYVASWVVRRFLENGYLVRTTVRSKKSTDKIKHLLKMADEFNGRLMLYEADLLQKGSFKDAMQDCEIVVHTASPFFIQGIKNAQEQLINPALDGTRNVLQTVNETTTVKRVVLTSSCAAIYGDAADIKNTENNVFTEEHWNTSSNLKHQAYSYSKTLAEQEAWKIAKAQQRWDLVVINPGLVLGPSLTNRADSTSIDLLISLMNGKFRTGVPNLFMPIVDVRNVADAHYLAAVQEKASGRHILVKDVLDILSLAKILRAKYPQNPIPKSTVPNWLFLLIGPFIGYTRKAVKLNAGIDMKFANTKSINLLGVKYTSINDTLTDHAEQLIADKLIEKR